MENIGIALQLMAVGMITVFVILMVVIQLSKGLIWIVNKLVPEESVIEKNKSTKSAPQTIDTQTMSIIQGTVTKLTNGKGQIKNITRI